MKKRYGLMMGLALLWASVAQAADPVLRIGARVFTEQTILAEITAQYLRQHGFDVRITAGLGSNLARSAQESGQLDLMWEYTGVSLVAYNHVDEKLGTAETLERVRELDGKKGLVWLTPSKFSNTYALGLPAKVARQYPQVNTISDLNRVLEQEQGKPHVLALDTEFANRSDGLVGLTQTYDLRFSRRDIRQMDGGLVYTALRNGQVFTGLVYTTDGRLDAFGLKLLEDDKHYFPDYTAAPVIRRDVLDAHPELADLLKPIAESLDNATMRQLNAKVDVQHQNPTQVAADFLREHSFEGGRS